MDMKEGWEIKKLGDVCQVVAGQSPEGKFYNSEGNGMPFYQGKKEYGEKYIGEPTKWTTKVTKEAEAGDILMSVRAPVGPVNFATEKICIGRGLAAIRAGMTVYREYLYNFLVHHENEIEGNTGAVFNSINKKQIEGIGFPLPPLPEQQRIVSILDRAFAAIDKAKANAEQNLQNARELFESYSEYVFHKSSHNWKIKTLGDVCSLYQGIAINAKTKHAIVEKSDLPLLRIKDLRNNTEEQYIDPNNYPKNALVNEEDIIYTRTGNSLGLVFRGRRGILHNNSFKIVPIEELTRDYLFIWLQNPKFKSKIFRLAFKAAQPDITHAIFKIQKIAIPTAKEQQDIVRQLDTLRAETQKLEAVYHKKIDDLEELKKSILQKAFAGELETEKAVAI